MNFCIQASYSSLESSDDSQPHHDTALDQSKLEPCARALFEKLTQVSSWMFDFDSSIRDEIEEENEELELFERVNIRLKSMLLQEAKNQGTFIIHGSSDKSDTGYHQGPNLLTSIENSRNFSSDSLILQISRRTLSFESAESHKPASPENYLADIEKLCNRNYARRIRLDCRRPAYPQNYVQSKLHYLAETEVIKRLNFSGMHRGTIPRTPRKGYEPKQTVYSTKDPHGLSNLQTTISKPTKNHISTVDYEAMKTVRKILKLESPRKLIAEGSRSKPSRAKIPYVAQTQIPSEMKLVVPPLGRLSQPTTSRPSNRASPPTAFDGRNQMRHRPQLPAIFTDRDEISELDREDHQIYLNNKITLKTFVSQKQAEGMMASHETLLIHQKPVVKTIIAPRRYSRRDPPPSSPVSPPGLAEGQYASNRIQPVTITSYNRKPTANQQQPQHVASAFLAQVTAAAAIQKQVQVSRPTCKPVAGATTFKTGQSSVLRATRVLEASPNQQPPRGVAQLPLDRSGVRAAVLQSSEQHRNSGAYQHEDPLHAGADAHQKLDPDGTRPVRPEDPVRQAAGEHQQQQQQGSHDHSRISVHTFTPDRRGPEHNARSPWTHRTHRAYRRQSARDPTDHPRARCCRCVSVVRGGAPGGGRLRIRGFARCLQTAGREVRAWRGPDESGRRFLTDVLLSDR